MKDERGGRRREDSDGPVLIHPSSFILHPSKGSCLVGPRGGGRAPWPSGWPGLGLALVDANALLEPRRAVDPRIFAGKGKADFRDREAALLAERPGCPGHRRHRRRRGAVAGNRELKLHIRARGLAPPRHLDTLWKQIAGDAGTTKHRPNLGVGGQAEVADVVAARGMSRSAGQQRWTQRHAGRTRYVRRSRRGCVLLLPSPPLRGRGVGGEGVERSPCPRN